MTFIYISDEKIDKFINVKEIRVIYYIKDKRKLHIVTNNKIYECDINRVMVIKDEELEKFFRDELEADRYYEELKKEVGAK